MCRLCWEQPLSIVTQVRHTLCTQSDNLTAGGNTGGNFTQLDKNTLTNMASQKLSHKSIVTISPGPGLELFC